MHGKCNKKLAIVSSFPILCYGVGRIAEQALSAPISYCVVDIKKFQLISSFISENNPDMLLVDAKATEDLDVIRQIRNSYPASKMKLIILAMRYERNFLLNLADIRADGYISSNTKPEQLVRALQSICSGQFYLQPDIMNELIRDMDTNSQLSEFGLNSKEFEILDLLARGISIKHISNILGVDENCIQTSITNMMKKMNVSNKEQAIARLTKYSRRNIFTSENK